jgi:hypothetical protein
VVFLWIFLMELLDFLIQVILFKYAHSIVNKKYSFWKIFTYIFFISQIIFLFFSYIKKYSFSEMSIISLFKMFQDKLIVGIVCIIPLSLALTFYVKYLGKRILKEQMELEKEKTENQS